MQYNPIITSAISPTDVKIYTEDGVPYLDYTGTFYAQDGCKCKIHFPKIGLTFTRFTQEKEDEEEYYRFGYKRVTMSFNVFITNDEWFKYEILEREASQKQLEKELGYKIKIKE